MLAVSALALSATFADQVMHALDFSIPIENKTYSLDGDLGNYDDKMLLAIHGYTGFDFDVGAGSKNDADFIIADFGMPIGVDAVFAIKLTDTFGLTAGLDIGTNIFRVGGLFGEYEEEEKEYHSNYYGGYYTTYTETESTSDFISSVFNGFTVTPRIGICWIIGD